MVLPHAIATLKGDPLSPHFEEKRIVLGFAKCGKVAGATNLHGFAFPEKGRISRGA
jgi:hypothetical protein